MYSYMCYGEVTNNGITLNGSGLDLYRAEFQISGNNISDNDWFGIFLSSDRGSVIDNNTINNNGYGEPEAQWNARSGITLYSSSPIITKNIISDNRGNGLLSFNASIPVLNLKESALNLIENNGSTEQQVEEDYEMSELFFHDYAYPQMDVGHNDIIDNEEGTYLFYIDPEGEIEELDITFNYWGMDEENFNYDRFYPQEILLIDPFDIEHNTTAGLTGGEEGMFEMALAQEDSGNFSDAYVSYSNIIATYPDSIIAYASLPRLLRCGMKSNVSADAMKNVYNSLQSVSIDPLIMKQINVFINECETLSRNFNQAIENINQSVNDSTSVLDSLFAEIDLNSLKVLYPDSGLAKVSMNKSSRADLLDNVLNRKTVVKTKNIVPLTFALFQNFPNPFNPKTNIKFQIPKSTNVTLEIFNILGQKIRTLIDNEFQDANVYEIQWNGKDNNDTQVGSGLYFFKLKTNEYSKTKKMILLR